MKGETAVRERGGFEEDRGDRYGTIFGCGGGSPLRKVSSDLTLIDAPPGTSCPVIESVRDANFVLLVTEPTPFGLNDLKPAVGMVRALDLPFAAVVNRFDMGDEQTRSYGRSEGIDIVAKIPDDRRVAEAYGVPATASVNKWDLNPRIAARIEAVEGGASVNLKNYDYFCHVTLEGAAFRVQYVRDSRLSFNKRRSFTLSSFPAMCRQPSENAEPFDLGFEVTENRAKAYWGGQIIPKELRLRYRKRQWRERQPWWDLCSSRFLSRSVLPKAIPLCQRQGTRERVPAMQAILSFS